MTRAIWVGVMVAAALASSVCRSQDAWPSKPVKIVVAFGPGGTADVLGRSLAAELSAAFNQQFYVENSVPLLRRLRPTRPSRLHNPRSTAFPRHGSVLPVA